MATAAKLTSGRSDMSRRQAEIIYGAIIGAGVGISYVLGKAIWGGDITTALNSSLVVGAAIGAAGGALAFMIRPSGS